MKLAYLNRDGAMSAVVRSTNVSLLLTLIIRTADSLNLNCLFFCVESYFCFVLVV